MELSGHPASLVSKDDSEALIRAVERATSAPEAGIFGPRSMSWKINRESALFLGAGRAALLQLAHPWVATALEQHSNLMSRPIERFHSTFRIMFAMIFGSLNQAVAAARHLYSLHTHIRGEMPQDIAAYPHGSRYEANEISALRWVYATLIESAVLAYECAVRPLTENELTRYFADSRTLAGLFGLPVSELPDDWAGFLQFCREMEKSNLVGVTPNARAMANNLLAGAGSWIKPPRWYRALTTEWLPEGFREEFELTFGEDDRRAALRVKRWLPDLYRRLPAAVRFIGPWHEAQARLNGKQIGLVGTATNRFWIGQLRLPFADRKSHA